MALLASSSRSTTMFCRPAPRAISRATAQRPSTFIRFATGPWTPRRVFRSAACITTRTALLKPSYSFSISVRRRIREFRSFRSMVSWRWASLAAFSRFWRLSIRRVWPWMTLSAAAASS